MSKINLSHHHLIVTGASGGLGQSLAAALVNHGARVTLVGRASAQLSSLAQRLAQPYLELDLLAPNAAHQLQHYVQQSSGTEQPVSGIIHNAGIANTVLYEDADWLTQQQVMALNLLVPMQITHALLPYFKQQSQAIVMTIGSVFGAIGYPSQTAYCASKAGLQRFSEALRRECYDSSVKVFHCMPRAIDTGLNSGVMSRLNAQLGNAIDTPQWVAERICQQLQQGQPQRVLGWPERLLVPLNMLLPRLVDNALRKPYQLVSQLLKEHSS